MTVNPDFAAGPLTERLSAYLATGAESQSTFAARVGVPQPALSKWLRGKQRLTHEQFLAVVTALPNASLPAGDDGGERRSPDDPGEAWPAARVALTPVPATLTHGEIAPSPLNPRKTFDDQQIGQLADSIAAQGLLQNLVVRRAGDRWVLVAGERRWRAIGRLLDEARWEEEAPIPVRVVDVDDAGHRILALLENVQRVEVPPLEEARAFAELVDLGVTTDAIADRISRSRRHVQLRIKLLDLAPEVQAQLATNAITLATARAVAWLPADEQFRRLKQADSFNWSAKQLAADIRRSWFRVELAAFPVEDCGLETVEEHGQRWFTNPEAFLAAQQAAGKARAEQLRADGWSWVRFAEEYDHQPRLYLAGRTDDRSAGGAVVLLKSNGKFTEHVGLVERPKTAAAKPVDEAAFQRQRDAQSRNHERIDAAAADAVAAFRTAPPEIVLAAVLTAGACEWNQQPGCSGLSDFDDPLDSVENDDRTWPSFEQLVPGFTAARDAGAGELLALLAQQPLSVLLRLLAIGAAGCNFHHPPGQALAELLGVALPELEPVP